MELQVRQVPLLPLKSFVALAYLLNSSEQVSSPAEWDNITWLPVSEE